MPLQLKVILILKGMAIAMLIAVHASHRYNSAPLMLSRELPLFPVQLGPSSSFFYCQPLCCMSTTLVERGADH